MFTKELALELAPKKITVNGVSFGADAAVLFTLAVATGYAFSGYTGLYDGQRIVYSKLDAKYVDVHVNKEVDEDKRAELEEKDGEEPKKIMK